MMTKAKGKAESEKKEKETTSPLDWSPGGGRTKTLRTLIADDVANGTRIMLGEVPDLSKEDVIKGVKEYFALQNLDTASVSRLTFAQNSNEIDVQAVYQLGKLKEIAPDVDVTELNTVAENASGADDKAKFLRSRQDEFKTKQAAYNVEKETEQKEAGQAEEAKTKYGDVQKIYQDLGLEDIMTDDDVQQFATQIAQGNITNIGLRNFLQQQPEYLAKQFEIERAAAKEEAAVARTELGQQLDTSSSEFLKKKALPQIERVYSRLGGTNRASTAAALSAATADVAKERENVLASAGLQDAAMMQGYRREDYLNQQNANYQMALQNWYNMTGLQNMQKQQTYQANQNKLAQIYGTQERQSSQNWQEYMANLQRGWASKDQAAAQKQQMWGALAGTIGMVGMGAGIGALFPGITAGQGALSGFAGMPYTQSNPYTRA